MAWSDSTWSRGTWNIGAVDVTIPIGQNSWNGGAYSLGPWNLGTNAIPSLSINEGQVSVLEGTGVIENITGELLNINNGSVTVTASSLIDIIGESLTLSDGSITVLEGTGNLITISGEQLNISVNDVLSATGTANVIITGEDLIAATVNTFAVLGDGAITINTPTLEANVELNNEGVIVGLASFLNIQGQELTISQGEEIISASATTEVLTGEEVNTSVNTITTQAGSNITISGELANVVSNTITVAEGAGITLNGQELLANTGDTIISASASMNITGELANIVSNTITVGEGTGAIITGQQLSINSGNVSILGNGKITITGSQANTTAANLKFWDPITGNVTEVWTNIH